MKKASPEEELYKRVPVNDLIIFGIFSVAENKNKCTFETLAHKCFTMFPAVFSLQEHNQWPDTRKLDRPLRSLRDEKMITGNPKTTFTLTKEGRKKALEVAKFFRQTKLL